MHAGAICVCGQETGAISAAWLVWLVELVRGVRASSCGKREAAAGRSAQQTAFPSLVQLDKGASETTSELCAAAAAARVSVSVASMACRGGWARSGTPRPGR